MPKTDAWYEVYLLEEENGELVTSGEPFGAADTFEGAMQEVALAIKDGHDWISIERIDREDDEAEHVEIAYVARSIDINTIDDTYVVPVRIVRPEDVPPDWRPSAGIRTVDGKKMKPLLDPAQLPGRAELLYQIEQLPHYKDSTYRNDVSPSRVFEVGGKAYKMFIAPARLMARTEEQGSQFMVFPIERRQGQTIDEALDEDDIDWSHPVVDTEDPMEVMRWLQSHGHADDSSERFALLDLSNKRRSARKGRDLPEFDDSDQRFALLDIDDPTVNPSRRRGRRNPDDVATAKEKYEEFHRHKPRKIWEGPSIIPAKVRLLGKAKAVLYRSDKNDPDTGRAVKKPINYIHDHDAGVKCYAAVKGGDVEVPKFIRDVDALVVLGKCLGYDFEDKSGVREAKGIKPLPDLCATPCGKALLVIQDRREVIAIIWGGGLGVEARGIVG